MRSGFLVLAVVLFSSSKVHAAEPSPSAVLKVSGDFLFGEAQRPYSGRLSGQVSLRVVPSGQGQDHFAAEFPVVRGLPNGHGGLFLRFLDDDPKTVDAPAWPLCLTRDGAGARALEDWLAGRTASDPSLLVHLVPRKSDPRQHVTDDPLPLPQNGSILLTNPEAVRAQAFLMGCGDESRRFVRYAKLEIPANALVVKLPGPNSPDSGFVVTSAALTHVVPRTWKETLPCIDPESRFRSIADGWSEGIQGVVLPPVEGPSVSEAVAAFARTMDGLVREMRVSEARYREIVPSLLEISTLPADPESFSDPIAQMEDIRRMLQQLKPGAAATLLGAADRALDALVGLPLGFDVPFDEPCEPPAELDCPCRPVYVSSRAKPYLGLPDGTLERPFRTVGGALEAVEDVEECVPEIRVAQGHYRENVAISSDVVLRARDGHEPVLFGTITVADPVSVIVSGLRLVDSDGLAAVAVLNSCASLRLEDVRIDRAARFGVVQTGGQLVMVRTRVLRTRSFRGANAYGTAVLIEGGARAALSGLLLLENEGPALLVQGTGTRVLVESSLIAENRIRRLVDRPPCGVVDAIAAVEVRHDARVEMQRCWLIRNEFVSLLATNRGSIRFRRGLIQETLQPEWKTSPCAGGFGAVALYEGRIDLAEFRVSRNELCGLQVGEGSQLDARDGVIDRNPIGVCLLSEGYDFDRVIDSVIFLDNESNVQATLLPLPDPGPISS